MRLHSTSDTEVIAALIARDERPLEEAVAATMARIEGAFSAVLLSEGKLVGFRDPDGIRPLVLGRLDGDWLLASESCAFDLLGAEVGARAGARRARGHRRRAVPRASRRSSRRTAARSASSSSSTSPGRTRSSAASSSTARACGWASASRPRRPPRPTSSWRSPTPAPPPRSASRARAVSPSPKA